MIDKIIHIVDHDKLPLCGISSRPSDLTWPVGHQWTSDDKEKSTCAKCRETAGLTVTSEHWLEHIKEIYAVLGGDKGGEGVVAANINGKWLPLIAADHVRLKDIMPLAQAIASETGDTLKLVKFTTREEVQEIKP